MFERSNSLYSYHKFMNSSKQFLAFFARLGFYRVSNIRWFRKHSEVFRSWPATLNIRAFVVQSVPHLTGFFHHAGMLACRRSIITARP